MNTVQLIIGDWSDDGHGKTDTVVVRSNLDARGIEAAYQAGLKKLAEDYDGDFYLDMDNLCDEYEDSSLPAKLRNYFVSRELLDVDMESEAFGYDYSTDWEYDPDADGTMDSDSFANLYISIARYGDPLLVIERVSDAYDMRINIGGYGLFYG